MKEIEKYNYDLVKKDIENLYIIYKDLLKEKKCDILIMGWFQYLILICIEALNYAKLNKTLKYKKIIENCRARMKPLKIDYNLMYQKMKKLNSDKMIEYKEYVERHVRILVSNWITNYGVYKINDKIIGNTFLYESLYKKIIYENSSINVNKILNVSKEIGETVSDLINYFELEKKYIGISKNIEIKCADYNVFKNNNKLLRANIDTNKGLILLNSISLINFYNFVISKMNVRKELKYRLGYIVYDNTHENISKAIGEEKIIYEKLRKFKCLNKKEFRNCMFHYNLENDLEDEEIKEEMYFGIIYKYLNISEKEYIDLIDEYMNEISYTLEKYILK